MPPFFGFVNAVTREAGDFRPGSQLKVFQADGHRIGAFICYEAVFPHFVRRFASQGAQVLVNVSNDGWFGRSAARLQHLSIARMRAVENRRWLLRSTNDGITAAIDPAGRVLQRLAPYERDALNAGFSFRDDKRSTPVSGDWFAVCARSVEWWRWQRRGDRPRRRKNRATRERFGVLALETVHAPGGVD